MTDGHIIADGPTKEVLNNEFLIEKTSLILPQICQFSLALKQLGLQEINKISSKNDMINYLRNFLKNKSSKT